MPNGGVTSSMCPSPPDLQNYTIMQDSKIHAGGLALVALGVGIAIGMRIRGGKMKTQKSVFKHPAPHSTWKAPSKMQTPWNSNSTSGEFVSLAPKEMKSAYSFFISAIVPRPIALVSSLSQRGEGNLAPFSFFTFLSYDPPILAFSCIDKGRDGGDTLKNIKETKQFVVQIISEHYVNAANHCSGNFDPEVNEFDESGLTKLASHHVAPPRVAEAAVQLECSLEELIPLQREDGKVGATTVLGRVELVHCNKHVLSEDSEFTEGEKPNLLVDIEKLLPMARLGGNDYASTLGVFTIARPPRPPKK